MDPISRAAQELLRELSSGFETTAALRLRAEPEQRATLIQSLRLGEWQPDSRWPLCLVEARFAGARTYVTELLTRLRDDFSALQRGLREDSVTIADPSTAAEPSPAGARTLAARLGAALAATGVIDGWCVALVPPRGPEDPAWLELVAALVAAPPPGLRWLVWDPAPEPLKPVVPACATLTVDEDRTWKYIEAQSARNLSEKPADAPRAALLAAAAAGRKGDLPGALVAYARAAAAYDRANAPAEAATVRVAMGGLSLGTGEKRAALGHFDRAVAQASRANAWAVACQAELGAAGALRLDRQLEGAERRYTRAADSALRAELPALRIEALRMAGTCALERGDSQTASEHWRAAVDTGAAMPGGERGGTTVAQVGDELIALLQRRGQTSQAAAVRAALAGK